MIQIIKQTRKEKIKLYKKLSKQRLAEMLYECNMIIDNSIIRKQSVISTYAELSGVREQTLKIEAYKECFEKFIPVNKWDEATEFLSTYGSSLAEDMSKKEK